MRKPWVAVFTAWALALGLGGLAVAATPHDAAQAQQPGAPAGQIKSLVGQVSLERAGVTQLASPGMNVLVGDRLITGNPGGVGIVLLDDTILTAGANSQFRVQALQFDANRQEGRMLVRLMKGALHMVTGLIARQTPQHVNIETPTAVLGVRGTEFIVQTAEAAP